MWWAEQFLVFSGDAPQRNLVVSHYTDEWEPMPTFQTTIIQSEYEEWNWASTGAVWIEEYQMAIAYTNMSEDGGDLDARVRIALLDSNFQPFVVRKSLKQDAASYRPHLLWYDQKLILSYDAGPRVDRNLGYCVTVAILNVAEAYMFIVGIDGTPKGWCAVFRKEHQYFTEHHTGLSTLFETHPSQNHCDRHGYWSAPIGSKGSRWADKHARTLLSLEDQSFSLRHVVPRSTHKITHKPINSHGHQLQIISDCPNRATTSAPKYVS